MALRQFGAAAAMTVPLALATPRSCGDRDPVVARDDRRQQRRRQQARRGLQRLARPTTRSCRPTRAAYPDTMNAGIAAFRAGNAPHIMQVFEVGTATMMGAKRRHQAGLPADEGRRRAVRSEGLSAGHHRLLLDLEGRDAVVPVQLVLDGDVDQQGRVEEGRRRRNPEDLAGSVRRRQEAEGRRLRHLRLLQRVGDLGAISSSSRPGTTCRSAPRPTASTASTPC